KCRRIGAAQSRKSLANDRRSGRNRAAVSIQVGKSAVPSALWIRTEADGYVQSTEVRGRGRGWRSSFQPLSQERATERASAEKIQLLRGTPTITLGQPLQMAHPLTRQGRAGARIEIRLSYEFEPMRRRCAEKIEKLNGMVVLGQELAEDVGGGNFCQLPRLCAQESAIGTGPGVGVHGRERGPGAPYTLLGAAISPRVEAQNILHRITQMPSWQDIIAHCGNAAVAETAADESENGSLHGWGDPAEYAVTNHIVEASSRQPQICEIGFLQCHILKTEILDAPVSIGYLSC